MSLAYSITRAVLACFAACSAPLTAQFPAYVLDAAQTNDLYGLHPSTGHTVPIGPAAQGDLSGAFDLAWRNDTRELWCIDNSDGDIGTLSAATAVFARSASLGLHGWYGIAWDASASLFYLSIDFPIGGTRQGRLYTYEPRSRQAQLVGLLPQTGFFALDCDANGQLWGVSPFGLYLIDKLSAQGSRFCAVPPSTFGLSIDRGTGQFFLTHRTGNGQGVLAEIVPRNGQILSSIALSGPTPLGFCFVDGVCPGRASTYGNGCAGSGGFLPLLALEGCVGPGQTPRLELSNVLTGSSAVALFGLGPGALSLGDGCTLLLDTPFASPILPIAILGSGGPGRGFGVLDLPIPRSTLLAPCAMQAIVLDRGVARGYALSNGVSLSVR